MIGQRQNFCMRQGPGKSFNSKTGWVPYQIKISRKSTNKFTTTNQPNQQQSDNTLYRLAVQCTTCLNANGPVFLQVGVRIKSK